MMAEQQVRGRFGARFWIIGCVVSLVLIGCAGAPQQEDQVKFNSVFYPPLPNPPYIQFLTSFSGARDVEKGPDNFAKFILGDESKDLRELEKPYGVAVYQGKIYAVDTRGPGYAVLDLQNNTYKAVLGGNGGGMRKPINISIDEDGSKYITDTSRNQILVFDKNDQFVRAFGVEDQFRPSDVAIAGDRLFVADLNKHQILVLDKQSGDQLYTFGGVGSPEGNFMFPTNLTIGPDQNLYVSDTGNFRVQVFTQEGDYLRSYGSIGSGLGKFARPKGVDVDAEGRMYVVDAAFQNVQLFNSEGRLLLFFGEAGHGPGNLNLPTDLTIDYKNAHYFQKFADPKFKLEYVILVSNQFGLNKINVYGFGKYAGMDYSRTR